MGGRGKGKEKEKNRMTEEVVAGKRKCISRNEEDQKGVNVIKTHYTQGYNIITAR